MTIERNYPLYPAAIQQDPRFGQNAAAVPALTASASTQALHSVMGSTARQAGGRLLDEALQSSSALPAAAASQGIQSLSYGQIFNLDPKLGFAANVSRLDPRNLAEHLRSGNVGGDKLTLGRFAKETLWGQNANDLSSIRQSPGITVARNVGIGLLAIDVAKHTKNAYVEAKAKYDDGTLAGHAKTLGSTALAFGVASGKGLLTWEASNVAFALGRDLFAKMTLGRIPFGGILFAAIGAAATSFALDKLIKDPPSVEETVALQQAQQANSFSGNPAGLPQQNPSTFRSVLV